MYWFDSLINRPDANPLIKVKYYYINPITKIIEVHEKIVVNEDEFVYYYNLNKSL
jgi:ABC-type polysaccharide/polyol phosphate export permease